MILKFIMKYKLVLKYNSSVQISTLKKLELTTEFNCDAYGN